MQMPENAANFIDRVAILLAPKAKGMSPFRANSASTAVAQICLVGNLWSKLLGLVHFSLDHMLPAQDRKHPSPALKTIQCTMTKSG